MPVGRQARLRPLSSVVLVLVAALGIGGFISTRQVVGDQEHKLLKQRTDEAGLYLSSALSSVEGTLGALAATAVPVRFSSCRRVQLSFIPVPRR